MNGFFLSNIRNCVYYYLIINTIYITIKIFIYMKNFFNSLKTLFLLVISTILFFLSITAFFKSMFINLLVLFLAIAILFLACDNFDKNNKLGKYADNNSQ